MFHKGEEIIFNEINHITLASHKDYISSLIELNERTIISASNDGIIIIWEIDKDDYNVLYSIKHEKQVYSLLKLNSDEFIVGLDSEIVHYIVGIDGYSRISPEFVMYHSEGVVTLVMIDENLFASGSESKTIKIWKKDGNGYKEHQTLLEYDRQVTCLLEYKGKLISSDLDGTIKVWERELDKFYQVSEYSSKSVTISMIISGNDEIITSGGKIIQLKLFNFNN